MTDFEEVGTAMSARVPGSYGRFGRQHWRRNGVCEDLTDFGEALNASPLSCTCSVTHVTLQRLFNS